MVHMRGQRVHAERRRSTAGARPDSIRPICASRPTLLPLTKMFIKVGALLVVLQAAISGAQGDAALSSVCSIASVASSLKPSAATNGCSNFLRTTVTAG